MSYTYTEIDILNGLHIYEYNVRTHSLPKCFISSIYLSQAALKCKQCTTHCTNNLLVSTNCKRYFLFTSSEIHVSQEKS